MESHGSKSKKKAAPIIIKSVLIISSLSAVLTNAVLATDNYYLVTTGGQYPAYPQVNYGTGGKAESIKRGEYLAKMGDCIACHTKAGGQPFAGDRAIPTPFGTMYTPNITPDKQTGIGDWTFKQFARAFTKGINPDNKYYYPAFPYAYFNHVTPQDVQAIWDYLQALPPVNQKVRKNDMMFPFNWRFLQLGWRILFFHDKGPYKINPKQSAEWNQGAYLVEGLGHCSMCHTEGYHLVFKSWNLGAPIQKYYLTGAFIQGFYAPNISSTGLAGTPVQEVEDVFLKDKLIGGGEVQGPMAEANHDSLKFLTQQDAEAIAIYLKSVKSQTPPRPKVSSSGEGKQIFNQYCSSCHLTGAGGAPKFGSIADWAPRIKTGLNTLYKNAINGIGGMPAKGLCSSCTNQEIQQAVLYMVNNSKPGAKGASKRTATTAPAQLTLAQGKQIYDQHCSQCHNGTDPSAPLVGNKAVWQPRLEQGMQTLIQRTIYGFPNKKHIRGNCSVCTDEQLIAAVKYMVNQSKTNGDYDLW